jgi:N-methylhydantoinase A/oxoprolinase/acetone carboxylase beta subunit
MGAADAKAAFTGTRRVAYGSRDKEARVYKWELLQPGNQVAGCSLLVSDNSTYFVAEGWVLTIDRYGNATVEREEKP